MSLPLLHHSYSHTAGFDMNRHGTDLELLRQPTLYRIGNATYRLGSTHRGVQGFMEFAHDAAQPMQHVPICIYDRLDEPTQGMLEENLADAKRGDTASNSWWLGRKCCCGWPVRSVGRDVGRRSNRREGSMKVHELMTESVVEIHSHHTIDHVRKMITQRKVGALPVVDNKGRPVGIVSTLDLVPALDGGAHISTIMADKVDTIAEDSEVSTAARLMRTHQIHHLVVIYDQKVVGMLSAFDLLKLVEDYSV